MIPIVRGGYYLPDNDLRTLIDRLRAAINILREQLAQESWNPWKTEQEQTATVKDIEIIPEDALLKIQTPAGLDKLKALFADLETQGMVVPGTTETIGDHFTETTLRDPSPEDSKPIEWMRQKYMLVHLLRRLIATEVLGGKICELEQHFTLKGKPFVMRHHSIKGSERDQRSPIELILKKHL